MKSTKWYAIAFFGSVISFQIMSTETEMPMLRYRWPNTADNWSLNQEFLTMLAQLLPGIETFVESGTYYGTTTEFAGRLFANVYSIELSPELVKKAREKFLKNPNITILEGSSDRVFYDLLPKIKNKGKILFFLDGHFSGGATVQGETRTPIVKELKAIKACGIPDAVILIDDLRGFEGSDSHYPRIDYLERLIKEINPEYNFYIYGDIGVGLLSTENIEISPLVRAMSDFKLLKYDWMEDAVTQADDAEKQALKKLYTAYGNFYHQWASLV